MPPWINPWLLAAEAVSFGLHFLILYVPVLANIFGIVPLTFQEWLLVILFASPVILIDEVCACALAPSVACSAPVHGCICTAAECGLFAVVPQTRHAWLQRMPGRAC